MTGCALCFVPSKKLKLPLCLPHCSRNQAVDPGGNSFHDSFQSKDPLVTWDYSAGQSCSPPFIFSSDSQSHLIIHLPGLERILPRPGNPLTRPQTAVEHQQVNGSDVFWSAHSAPISSIASDQPPPCLRRDSPKSRCEEGGRVASLRFHNHEEIVTIQSPTSPCPKSRHANGAVAIYLQLALCVSRCNVMSTKSRVLNSTVHGPVQPRRRRLTTHKKIARIGSRGSNAKGARARYPMASSGTHPMMSSATR